jgi:hypothetical protein
MPRMEFQLPTGKFTRMSELVREIGAFLKANPHYKLQVSIPASKAEELSAEVEMWRGLGRVKVIVESGTQEGLFSD